MPTPGFQHSNIANQFEEPQRRVSEYTAQEISTLQCRLEKQLGPEYLSARSGPAGQKLHYIAAEKCIALANEVFGFNGWSSSVQNMQVDFCDENPQTFKISLGISVIVRVTLRDGTFHEDIGYGHIENCKGKAAAFEKAKKEGTTDALKRALRNFGNVLGNCIYDKAYLAKVTKMKVEPTKFDEGGLHRHAAFAHISKESMETEKSVVEAANSMPALATSESLEDFMGDFDVADFCVPEDEFPDVVTLTDSNGSANDQQQHKNAPPIQPPPRPLGRSGSAGNAPPRLQPQTPNQFLTRQNSIGREAQNLNQSEGLNQQNPGGNTNVNYTHSIAHQQTSAAAAADAPPGESPGFFSARAVKQIPEDALTDTNPDRIFGPQAGQGFNPHAESPSIRKTPGIDHTKSKPVGRHGQHVAPTNNKDGSGNGVAPAGAGSGSAGLGGGTGFGMGGSAISSAGRPGPPLARGLNPAFDQARRIGAPGGTVSPHANRHTYKPPTMMKRPVAGEGDRAPLIDVSSNAVANGAAPGPDTKRQRVA